MAAIEQAGARPGAGWEVLASDGSVVRIRPLRADDEPALDAMNSRLSDRSIYLRFFGISRSLAGEHTRRLLTAHDGHVALVAECNGTLAGVASYEPLRQGEAEMAFLLDDSVHRRGNGKPPPWEVGPPARQSGDPPV